MNKEKLLQLISDGLDRGSISLNIHLIGLEKKENAESIIAEYSQALNLPNIESREHEHLPVKYLTIDGRIDDNYNNVRVTCSYDSKMIDDLDYETGEQSA